MGLGIVRRVRNVHSLLFAVNIVCVSGKQDVTFLLISHSSTWGVMHLQANLPLFVA